MYDEFNLNYKSINGNPNEQKNKKKQTKNYKSHDL